MAADIAINTELEGARDRINELPDELLVSIFSRLLNAAAERACRVKLLWVCRRWRALCVDASLWPERPLPGKWYTICDAAILASAYTHGKDLPAVERGRLPGLYIDLPARVPTYLQGLNTAPFARALSFSRIVESPCAWFVCFASAAVKHLECDMLLDEPKMIERMCQSFPGLESLSIADEGGYPTPRHREGVPAVPYIRGLTNGLHTLLWSAIPLGYLTINIHSPPYTGLPLSNALIANTIPCRAQQSLRSFTVHSITVRTVRDNRGFFFARAFPNLEAIHWIEASGADLKHLLRGCSKKLNHITCGLDPTVPLDLGDAALHLVRLDLYTVFTLEPFAVRSLDMAKFPCLQYLSFNTEGARHPIVWLPAFIEAVPSSHLLAEISIAAPHVPREWEILLDGADFAQILSESIRLQWTFTTLKYAATGSGVMLVFTRQQ